MNIFTFLDFFKSCAGKAGENNRQQHISFTIFILVTPQAANKPYLIPDLQRATLSKTTYKTQLFL